MRKQFQFKARLTIFECGEKNSLHWFLIRLMNCNSERIPCRFCLTAVLRGLQGASIPD